MAASHLTLFLLTGRPVIGVFHTLSAGKAGHVVPGSVWPAAVELLAASVVAGRSVGVERRGFSAAPAPAPVPATDTSTASAAATGSAAAAMIDRPRTLIVSSP